MSRKTISAAALAAALSLPAAAQAHVTLQPSEAPAGGFARLDVRVPNEEEAASTTKVVVQLPPGFADASYEPVPGWSVRETRRKLPTPIETEHGDTRTDELATISFTAAPGEGVKPGQFQDFGLSLGLPDKPAGTKLTFKALQTYSGGEVVRWIGPAGSDRPAPIVTLVAAGTDAANHAAATPAAATDDGEDDDGGGDGLALVALVVGALGLLAGGAALFVARRATA